MDHDFAGRELTPENERVCSRSWSRFFLRVVAGFAGVLSMTAQAVNPPPDGGYPNGNTAEGTDSLFNLRTGGRNTAIGNHALFNLTSGYHNTALGFRALSNIKSGVGNTASGSFALSTTTGDFNTATGASALTNNTSGNSNTATGSSALYSNTTGVENTANGDSSLGFNTVGNYNTASGNFSLLNNTEGNNNTATGAVSLYHNTLGSNNTANGTNALAFNISGDGNTGMGDHALEYCTGNFNIALGFEAGSDCTWGDNNIDIGNPGAAGESSTIRIGAMNQHKRAFVAGIYGVTVADGVGVIVNRKGQLGTVSSSEKFKEKIKPMDKASEAILDLNPVTFRYKPEWDPEGVPQFGLVAEEVEKINPALVVHDDQGKIYSVRYEAVNAMLLNEFLKEHRKVEALGDTVSRQQQEIEALTARLLEQASQIQKVSEQLEKKSFQPVSLAGSE